MTFYWLTPFFDSFINSDWLELIIYFHTNKYSTIVQMIVKDDRGKAIAWQMVSDNVITFRIKKNSLNPLSAFCKRSAVCILYLVSILYPGFAVCILYWPAIDMFFEGSDISVSLPTGYGKSLIYQAAPVIDRLSPLEETGHYNYCVAN